MSSRLKADGEQPQPDAARREPQPAAWLHARARLAPRLLAEAPVRARHAFRHEWAPMEALAAQVRLVPAAVWDYLLGHEGGAAVIVPGESRYEPGEAVFRGRPVVNVAYISVLDLADDNERPLHVLAHLADHYLGSGGDPPGPWLSDGAGIRPDWQQAGARLAELYSLGHGVDEIARSGSRDYLAQSVAIYCREPGRLNVADPRMWKWLRATLFDERFWQNRGGQAAPYPSSTRQ